MQLRTGERFLHRSSIQYSGIGVVIEGHGVVIDLSKSGCRVETDTVPAKGAERKFQLFLADYSWPMKIDRAVVRWVKKRTVGREFVALQSSQ
jgi:PilZ domain